MRALRHRLDYPVQFLRPVTHPDSKHQERHQDRERVQFIAQRGQDTQLPDDRHQGAEQHHQGRTCAARIPVQQDPGDDHRDQEEQHNRHHAIDQVTDDLGKAGNMNFHIALGLVTAAQLVKLLAEGVVVQPLPGLGNRIQQRDHQGDRPAVVRHQVTDDSRPGDIDLQLIDLPRRAVEFARDYAATLETVLGHHFPAGVGGKDRFHADPVYPRREEHFLVNRLRRLQENRFIDRVSGGLDRQTQVVTQPRQVVLVLEVIDHVLVLFRQHLFKRRLQLGLGRLVAQHDCRRQAQQHHQGAVVEDQPFEEAAAIEIELRQVRDDREVGLLCMCHLSLCLRIISSVQRSSDRRDPPGPVPRACPQSRQRR